MSSTILLIPIPADKVDAWKEFVAAGQKRSAEHSASRKRMGVTHELGALAETAQGAFAVVYREAADVDHAHSALLGSTDPYDKWCVETALGLYGMTAESVLPSVTTVVHHEYRA